MSIRPTLAPAEQMTIAEFLGFTASRPHEERWELIEGVPILNASPVDYHQIICGNIIAHLLAEKERLGATWLPLIGIGMRVPASPNSLLQPDVFIMEQSPTGRPDSSDALVIFEVLSRSNTNADQAWRRRVYASVPNCRHYVTVSLNSPRVVVYDRLRGWAGRSTTGLDAAVAIEALAVEIPMSVVYRYVPATG